MKTHHALGRARRLGALRRWGLGGGALGLERLALALAVDVLGGGDLGLVREHVRVKGCARRVDVGLEAGVDGAIGAEVPVATGVDARHQTVGDAALSADLFAQVRLRVDVKGPLMHQLALGVSAAPVVQVVLFVCEQRAHGVVSGGLVGVKPKERLFVGIFQKRDTKQS
jgi:hypothetical protein